MKTRYKKLIKLIKDHKWFLTGLSAGFIPGSHPVLSVIGGTVGFFLDILSGEINRSRRLEAFVRLPEPGILERGETMTAAEIMLCLEFQYLEGISSSYMKSNDNRCALMTIFSHKPEGMRILEKILNCYPYGEKPEPEQLAIILKDLLLPSERSDFNEILSNLLPGEGISAGTSRLISRINEIWEIPAGKIPDRLKSRKEYEECWEILGLPPDSPAEEIRRSYRKLSGQFHPDTAGGLSSEQRRKSEEAFLKIRRAYDFLMGKRL